MAAFEIEDFDFAAAFFEDVFIGLGIRIGPRIGIAVDHRDGHVFAIVFVVVLTPAEPTTTGNDAFPWFIVFGRVKEGAQSAA